MPVYRLTKRLAFPSPEFAAPDGLLAVGGDLSVERLRLAYSLGIFPWYSEGDPILWWSPDPRMILLPEAFHASKSLRRLMQSGRFRVTLDTAFDAVIAACARVPRREQDGTWITPDMLAAYKKLHRAGYAHSVECWEGPLLAGGLYGISLGSCFFGESMFSTKPNASKVALASLVLQLREWQFTLIDCQIHTAHLSRLGAKDVPRSEFLARLTEGMRTDTRTGVWHYAPEAPRTDLDAPGP